MNLGEPGYQTIVDIALFHISTTPTARVCEQPARRGPAWRAGASRRRARRIPPGEQDRVFAGATTDVEHLAVNPAGLLQLGDRRLRFADHPRRGAGSVGPSNRSSGGVVSMQSSVLPERS